MTLVQNEPKKIYIRVEAQPITTAWIYHNSDLWLISLSSDWNTWLTIADKNLGATSTDVSSSASYWNYYQRWNCYGFPNTWDVTVSYSTVNASTYWPTNPYSSSTFILSENWESSNNNDLWGDNTDTLVARKWPCDNGFHVPTYDESSALIDACVSLWIARTDIRTYIKLPLNWRRWYTNNWIVLDQWSWGYYWTSSTYWSGSRYSSYTIEVYSSWISNWGAYWWGGWYWIRPFKNSAVQPDEWWTVLYQ